MIRFSLECDKDHEFEAWFSSSKDFDNQAERGLVEWLGSPSSFFDGVPPAAYLADDPTAVAEAASSAFGTAW